MKYTKIQNFETYGVSKKGEVINLKTQRILKLVKTPHGYLSVGIIFGGKKRSFRVHRLVAQTFIPNPENKPQVNHIDGDKLNNDVSNLEWVTHTENIKHAFENNLIKTKKPIQLIKISDGTVLYFESTAEASRFLGVNNGTLNAVLKRKRLSIHGYKAIYL